MQRRILIPSVLSAAFILIVGSLLFGGIPEYSTPQIFKSPLTHNAHEAPPSGTIKTDDSNVAPPAAPVDGAKPAGSDPSTAIAASVYKGPLHITITETGGSHDEVVAALVHSFGSQPEVVIELYQLLQRYRIVDIMNGFALPNPVPKSQSPKAFIDNPTHPDLFVAGTCELDIIKFKDQLAVLLAKRKTYLFCVVHHADRWANEELKTAIRPWVDAGLVEFWTLSPHTEKFLLNSSIAKWAPTATKARVRHFVPVFPVPLPADTTTEELAFGLQGDYDPSRRDYQSIFRQLSSFLKGGGSPALDESTDRNVTMHLLGNGKHPTVPVEISSNVNFDEKLDYIDYYSIISRTFALLPAFASDQYLDRKASSSVPAALIGGTPLVATQAILNAYSYIDKEVVWLQGETETDLDVVGRILDMGPMERQKKKEEVRKRCAAIVEKNAKTLELWINEAMQVLGGDK